MNTISTDTLLFSKWTRDGQCELAERFYLVVACQRDAQGLAVRPEAVQRDPQPRGDATAGHVHAMDG